MRVNRDYVNKLFSDLIKFAEQDLKNYKHYSIWDAERYMNAFCSGVRMSIYASERTPSQKVARVIEVDVANHLAYQFIFDNWKGKKSSV